MAEEKMTHEVVHGKLYLAVEKKLQHVPKGTQLALDAKVASGLGDRVLSLAEKAEAAKAAMIAAKKSK